MGDRALVIFTNKQKNDFSPVVYLHNDGHAVPTRIEQLKELMKDRTDDVSYAAARFVGVCHERHPSNLSLGMWNLSPKLMLALATSDEDTIRSFSHGDAGIVLVDSADFSWKAYGGYLVQPDPLPETDAA